MGVGIQRKSGAVVPQHPGDCLDVHPVLQGQSCERMSQIVEADLGETCPLQYPMQHVEYAVRRNGSSSWRREYIWAVTAFLFLLPQNAHRICRQRQGAVGIFRLQRCLNNLTIDSGDLPMYPEVALFQINILPLQPQQFTSPEASSQFDIV